MNTLPEYFFLEVHRGIAYLLFSTTPLFYLLRLHIMYKIYNSLGG